MAAEELVEIVVGFHFFEHRFHQTVDFATFAVIGFGNEVHTVVFNEFSGLVFVALVVGENGDGMAAKVAHKHHARHIGHTVAKVNHVLVLHWSIVVGHVFVHLQIVAQFLDASRNLEDELRFGCGIYCHTRPVSHAVGIVKIGAAVNGFKLVVDRCALNHFAQTRGIDVVLDVEAEFIAHLVDDREPLLHTRKQLHHGTEFLKTLTPERDAVGARFFQHGVHIGEDVVGIVVAGKVVALFPKLVDVVANGLNEAKFLHIAGCECDHPRNLDDEQMKALCHNDGVMQITLYHGFLRTVGEASILDALNHLNHAVDVMGIDCVGIGTDFDGDGGVTGLANASEVINFTRRLLKARYSENDIAKLWGGNFLRVMTKVQSVEE